MVARYKTAADLQAKSSLILMNPDLAPLAHSAAIRRNVPVIDLGGLTRMHNPATVLRVANEIGDACRDWGFFQIVNHGVEGAHIEKVWEAVAAFFELPRPEKRVLNRTSEHPWGFFDRELTKNLRDKKEIFDIGPDINAAALSYDPFSGATPWPASQPTFRNVMRKHFSLCEQLSQKIMEAICFSFDLPKAHLAGAFKPYHTSFLRINYYPVDDPLSDLEGVYNGDADLGIHHHSDAGAVTVLLQDDVSGLEVFKDGVWHVVQPIEGAFVINIGDMMQVWSNDEYRAPLHRVAAMDEIVRYSIPFFYNPSYTAQVTPLDFGSGPKRYHTINWGEFRRRRADGDFANIGKEVQISDYAVD